MSNKDYELIAVEVEPERSRGREVFRIVAVVFLALIVTGTVISITQGDLVEQVIQLREQIQTQILGAAPS